MTNKRILVADDDDMIVDALRYQLQREGYAVIIADDGESARHMQYVRSSRTSFYWM